jgi:ketosteroid isomerase-like protein
MDKQSLITIAQQVLDAWNRQDVDAVVDCYAEDCAYLDPNTRGPVVGRENLRRYLTKLFSRWQMHWTMRELFPLAGDEGSAFLWHARLTPAGGGPTVEVEGMDLALLQGDKLRRNEVYFDRMALLPTGKAPVGSTAGSGI